MSPQLESFTIQHQKLAINTALLGALLPSVHVSRSETEKKKMNIVMTALAPSVPEVRPQSPEQNQMSEEFSIFLSDFNAVLSADRAEHKGKNEWYIQIENLKKSAYYGEFLKKFIRTVDEVLNLEKNKHDTKIRGVLSFICSRFLYTESTGDMHDNTILQEQILLFGKLIQNGYIFEHSFSDFTRTLNANIESLSLRNMNYILYSIERSPQRIQRTKTGINVISAIGPKMISEFNKMMSGDRPKAYEFTTETSHDLTPDNVIHFLKNILKITTYTKKDFHTAMEFLVQRKDRLEEKDLRSLFWILKKAMVNIDQWLDPFMGQTMEVIRKLKVSDMISMYYQYVMSHGNNPQILTLFHEKLKENSTSLKSNEISILFYVHAYDKNKDMDLQKILLQKITDKNLHISPTDIISIVRAFAILNISVPNHINQLYQTHIRSMKDTSTHLEKSIASWMRTEVSKLGVFSFESNKMNSFGVEMDIVVSNEFNKLNIECDGVMYHNTNSEKHLKDDHRDALVREAGFGVMRVTDKEFYSDPEHLRLRRRLQRFLKLKGMIKPTKYIPSGKHQRSIKEENELSKTE
ncbi:MAG: DUF559 domain-containing protein [Candidatus Gracilibacteria bacterium]